MNIYLSPAEIGVIIHAMEQVYQSGTAEMSIVQELYDRVYSELAPFGLDMYQQWVDEFDLLDVFM